MAAAAALKIASAVLRGGGRPTAQGEKVLAPGAEGMSDPELLARVASGDAAAARALTERHLGRVLSLAERMLADRGEAEDVAQEAMMRLWRLAGRWREEGAQPSTWLHRVTVNLCYDRLRKARRRRTEPLEAAPDPADPAPSAESRLSAEEEARELRAALDEVPERQRAALILRHFEERSNPEIAATLEVSVEAVESLLSRGRRKLRAVLERRRSGGAAAETDG